MCSRCISRPLHWDDSLAYVLARLTARWMSNDAHRLGIGLRIYTLLGCKVTPHHRLAENGVLTTRGAAERMTRLTRRPTEWLV